MKKVNILLYLLATVLASGCINYSEIPSAEPVKKNCKDDGRFEIVYPRMKDRVDANIVRDRETGVNYLIVHGLYGTGVTPLLQPDGKPVVTPTDH